MKETTLMPYNGTALSEAIQGYQYTIDENQFNGVKEDKARVVVEDIDPYFPSKDLLAAIEYARVLKRPLLLRGDPGCGKTRVAQALAYELYCGREADNYRNHYFEWFIKSTTKSKEGLYHFDHLMRLRDVQAKLKKPLTEYRRFGPLGKAFLASKPNAPAILLIDEIDKADIDFPNDLLLELDEKRFYIEETGEEIRAEFPPIVIITSNDEKELPNAFLRRCVFHYIDFPDEELLLKIARARINRQNEEFKKVFPEGLVEQIVFEFDKLYKAMYANPNTSKLVSTSEFLDWLRVIHYYFLTDKLLLVGGKIQNESLLFPEVLLKSLDDFKQFKSKKQ